jgi:uncharacterized protein (TIGR02118 family)
MYKVIWLTKFRPGMDREEVLRWWRGPHAELAAATPGMVRYVQSHWVEALDGTTHMPAGPPAFDGHAEHWFESRESYEAAMASDQWRRTVADGPTGFDASTLVGGALVERVISWDASLDGRTYSEGVPGPRQV